MSHMVLRSGVCFSPVSGRAKHASVIPLRSLVMAVLLSVAGRWTAAQTCTAPPTEARALRLIGTNPTQLMWQPPMDPGGTQTIAYDVLRSQARDGFTSATCVVRGTSDLSIVDPTPPAPILFYLVRAKNACGETLGTDSSGIPATGPPCLLEDGTSCAYDTECAGGGCCSGICTDVVTDPEHCGACTYVCSSNHVTSRTCSSRVCGGTCSPGF